MRRVDSSIELSSQVDEMGGEHSLSYVLRPSRTSKPDHREEHSL